MEAERADGAPERHKTLDIAVRLTVSKSEAMGIARDLGARTQERASAPASLQPTLELLHALKCELESVIAVSFCENVGHGKREG